MNNNSKSYIISELKRVIKELSKDDLSSRIVLSEYDEDISPLVEQINHLIERLNEKYLTLKISESKISEKDSWYLSLFKKNPQPMWVYDSISLSFLAVNEAAVKKYGYSQEDFIRMKLSDISIDTDSVFLQNKLDNFPKTIYKKQKLKNDSIIYVESISHSLDFDGSEAILELSYDVTDRKHYEDVLRNSQDRQKLAIEGADLGTWDWNVITGEVKVNDRWSEMLGYKPTELKPSFNMWKNLVHPEDYDEVISAITEHLTNETLGYEKEYRLRHKSGEWIWVLDKGRVIDYTDDGKAHRVCGTHLDITEKKKNELIIRENELRLSNLINQAGDAFFLCDTSDYKIVEVNEFTCISLGYTRDELINKSVDEIDGKFYEIIKTPFNFTGKDNYTPKTIESFFKRKDGSFIPVEIRVSYLEFNSKKYIMGFARDITFRKKIEHDLLVNQFAIEKAREAIYWIKSDTSIVYVNEAACKSLGYSKKELLKLKLFDIDPVFPKESWDQHWAKTRELGSYTIESFHKRKDGSIFPLEILISFMSFEGEEYHCAFARDITERKKAEEALQRSERLLKESQKIAGLGHFTVEFRSGNWESSETLDEIIGIDYNFEKNIESWLEIVHPEDRSKVEKFLSPYIIDNKLNIVSEYRIIRSKDKCLRWVHCIGEIIPDESGNVKSIMGTLQDITSRKKSISALRLSEARLSEAQRIAKIGNWDWDVQNNELFWSQEVFRIFEINPDQVKENFDLYVSKIHPDDKDFVLESINDALYKNHTYSLNHRIIPSEGKIKHIHAQGEIHLNKQGKPVRMFGTVQDINELKLTEEKLLASLNDKDVLLRELYHRTKNNMQVIQSILALQAYYSGNQEFAKLLKDTENRIQAMSLVHEKLYQSNNLSSIDLKEYITDLVNLLVNSYSGLINRVTINMELESIELLLDSVIPCGLIINELISNSMKHAFPLDRKGEIIIKLLKNDNDEIELTFSDNGIGVPDNFDFKSQPTLGLQSIFTIAEHQLNSKVKFQNINGVSFSMVFNNTSYSKRV